ncbi:MAG: hypothetical protein MUF49_26315 [Oculatellaceae cyanobacterium Prado106]|nr:hypothetical protein [Oculatellaceae cyanobacterium Prado106]
MAFSSYKTLGEAVKAFQITYTEADFITGVPFPISDYFRQDLQLMMREGVVDNSEFAICENLIFPILKEVWKQYRTHFLLWSHQSLTCDETLSGFPEYILAKRSPLGKVVFDQPYFLLVEAKQDNFDAGWGQCLAEMIAAQRLNGEPPITIFGIVSNGATWQFGKLEANTLTRNIIPYTIYDLDPLFAGVNAVFQQCEAQLQILLTV